MNPTFGRSRTMRFFERTVKLVSFSWAVVTMLCLFLLIRLDWIVNNTRYNYGPSFSYDWFVPYWSIQRFSMLSLGAIAAVAFILPFMLSKVEGKRALEKKIIFMKAKGLLNYKKTIITLALFIAAGSLGIASTILNSDVLILAALGLVIWGTMLLLATTQKVVKVNLAALHLVNSTVALDSLLSRFGYDGHAIIDPPMTIGDNPSLQIFRTVGNREKASFTPLGLDLAFLIEKKSPVDLFLLEFDTFAEFLSKMFTDELELAGGFAMSRENSLVRLKMSDFIFQDLCVQIENSNPNICKRQLCPICSSIACLISKVTHKSVSLERKVLYSSTVEVWFKIHEPLL